MARTFSSAGEGKLNRHLASQAAYELASVVADEAPSDDAQPEEWAEYVQKAYGKAAAAIIEVGKRINMAHAAYMAQGQTWGRTWEEWCQTNLGYRATNAYKRMKIAENLCRTATDILPPDTESLYALARINEKAPEAFSVLVNSGRIHPTMTREQVKTITVEAIPVTDKQQAESPKKPPKTRSLRVDAGIAELLEQRANARGQTISELLMEFLQAP